MGVFSKIFAKEEKKDELKNLSGKLDKVLVNLSKDKNLKIGDQMARVALVMDYSGSMFDLYKNGDVQDTITRLLPIALKFDDNGELESWIFTTGYMKRPAITQNNYEDYAKKKIMGSSMCMGGTEYAPVLKDIVNFYVNENPNDVPAFIIFITDGDNSDKDETDKVIKKIANYNMFVQFIGIGYADFRYLRSLDDMEGRACDNTGFTAVSDMNKMRDDELYNEILRQYNDWLNRE